MAWSSANRSTVLITVKWLCLVIRSGTSVPIRQSRLTIIKHADTLLGMTQTSTATQIAQAATNLQILINAGANADTRARAERLVNRLKAQHRNA